VGRGISDEDKVKPSAAVASHDDHAGQRGCISHTMRLHHASVD
jgi:hypothetical protein